MRALAAALFLMTSAVPTRAAAQTDDFSHQFVAVGVVKGGQAVLLATPGLETRGRHWRFRPFDTSEVAGPLRQAVLSIHATKLFLQSPGHGLVIDLTRQRRHNALQHVDALGRTITDGPGHRLPLQRFVEIRDGKAYVVNDTGAAQDGYPVLEAVDAAISGAGAVLYLKADRTSTICGETAADRHLCRDLPAAFADDGDEHVSIVTGPAQRFLLLVGTDSATRIVDPDSGAGRATVSAPMRRTVAALHAALTLNGFTLSDARVKWLVAMLDRESAGTIAGGSAIDWRFFRVSPDVELYAPVLEVTASENVFPSAFGTLEDLAPSRRLPVNGHRAAEALLDRYLRLTKKTRRERCTIYYRIRSAAGSWVIEYWLYYPFDSGGLGSHLHDPEHVFVEVDKLGGTVRKVIAAAHGFVAPNNTYTTDLPGAMTIELPLHIMVEQHKHASAPDIDRDRVFTPGIDENEYKERAKVWGVRDVIGTNNNQLMSFDRTMSADRKTEDFLAPLSVQARFPEAKDLAPLACCRLEPIPESPPNGKACAEPTTDCAIKSVTTHPDFVNARTILKDWVFPHSFMRLTYGLGPRQRLHSLGVGFASDLDRMPGLSKLMPLPGRVGAEVFGWRQEATIIDPEVCKVGTNGDMVTPASTSEEQVVCKRVYGVGASVRYEQFLSNLFGIYSAMRVYTGPVTDVWFTFGPMVEMPLGNSSNVSFQAGLSFRPYASPRFEMRMSLGLWKPRTAEIGLRARPDGEK